MNDENPYASPETVGDGEPNTKPTWLQAHWQSIRGGLAIACFAFTAMYVQFMVLGFFIESKSNFTDVAGLWAIAGCAMLGVACALMGWGARSRRNGIALAGIALVAIPWLVVRLVRMMLR
ncbi:MAG TPA: hypothetical protein VND64_34490 [Pirellulales bacterium]|nr:hypothetical protein [Pirellulales bacterium]